MLLASLAFAGGESPQTFTYQGRFLNSAGTAPLASIVDVQFDILSPSGTCLLYEEVQTGIDLSTTNGLFALQVGSAVGDPKRTTSDPGLLMSRIFANPGSVVLRPDDSGSTGTCVGGYTPAAGDSRKLRVTVTPQGGSAITLTPDETIGAVPQASVAETLQGFSPNQFIQVEANVSQSTMETLTNGGDASALHNHDSLYVRLGSTSNQYFGSGNLYTNGNIGIKTSSPTGDLGFGGGTARFIEVERTSGTTNPGGSLTVSAGAAASGATNQSGGNLVLSSGVSTGSAASGILFNTSGGGLTGTTDKSVSTKMVVTGAGNVGIGTTTPGSLLDVNGTAHFAGAVTADSSASVGGNLTVTGNASVTGTLTASGATTLNNTLSVLSPAAASKVETIRGAASQSGNLLELQNSSGTALSYFDASGYLTLPGVPTSASQAATKGYVDTATAAVLPSGGTSSEYLRGDKTWVTLNTTAVPEGTNLYYTDARARAAISGTAPLSYNSATGAMSISGLSSLGTANQVLGMNAGATGLEYKTINGTTNQVTVTNGANAITLSLPQSINTAATPTFGGMTLTGFSGVVRATAGVLSASALSSADITGALGYTPVNKAGDTMTGALTISSNLSVTGTSTLGTVSTKALTVTSPATTTVAATIKAIASQSAHLLDIDDSAGTPMSYFDASGYLTLPGVPTSSNQAATKGYVDAAVASGLPSGGTTSDYLRGDSTWRSFNTDARAAISGTAPLSYNSATGAMSISGLSALGTANQVLGMNAGATGLEYKTINGTTNQVTVTNGANAITLSLPQSINTAATPTFGGMTLTGFSGVVRATAGVLSASALSSADVTGALGYTPVNKAGDTMTGTLTLSADPTSALQAATKQYVDTGLATKQNSLGFTPINKAGDTGVGSLALAATKTFGLGSYTAAQETTLVSGLAAADAGKTWYNSDTGEIKYWDGTTSHALGLAGGITSLNGLTGSVQTFAIGTTGNSPAFSSSGSTHTLNIPLASGGATVTAGLISNADYVAFNGKQNALGYIPVNKAGDTMTGALTTKALTVTSPATTTVAATIKAIASQSAHLLDIDDSAGTPMSYFDASGYLTLPGVPTSASQAATKGYVDSAVSSLTLATLTRGTGLTGANYNGSTATTWAVSYGSTAGTAVQGNTSITVSAGTGLSGGGSITLGAGGTVTLTNSDAGSSQNIFKSIANSAGTAQFSAASNSDKIEFGGTGLSTVSFTPASHLVSIDTTLATLTRGTGLTGTSYDGSAATTWAVSYGSTAGTAVQGNTGLTISAGSGISVTGGSVTLGSGGTVTVTNSGVTSFNTRTGAVTLSSADVTGALGYTPQSALTAGTGISIAAGTISNSGVTSFNGSTGAVTGVSSLGGLTASSQSLAIGTSGTAPNWSSVTSTHTLNIPMASTAGVTAGLISNADWTTFNNKQAALTAGSGISISSNTVTNTGVRSFNTRTGAVTLTSSDVTGALTYTPVNKAGDTMTGTLTATGFLYSSDRRLKENIETIHSALDKVLALRGVTFQWRATGKKDLGFIAQEVEKVVPRLVGERPDGYKAVEYGNIVALTVEAIKTLKAKIDSLFEHDSVQDREIAAMKKEVELLKNQVEQQNAVIQAQGEALRKLAGEKQ